MRKRVSLFAAALLLATSGILTGLWLTDTARAEDPRPPGPAEEARDQGWEAMHQACTDGDLDAMQGLMEELGVDWEAMHEECAEGDMQGMLDSMKEAHAGWEDVDDMHAEGSHCGGDGGVEAMHGRGGSAGWPSMMGMH